MSADRGSPRWTIVEIAIALGLLAFGLLLAPITRSRHAADVERLKTPRRLNSPALPDGC